MKTVQYFNDEYLEQCSSMSREQVIKFIEDFRSLYFESRPVKSKLISIKIPEDLLNTFRMKAELHDIQYQTQIKKLMREWIDV